METNSTYWGILSEQRSYRWATARAYELNALTNTSSIGRETNLAAMLFYLGHVIHLNQDLTVPAHVRNDNHGVNAPNGPFAALVMWTENFGAAQCTNNPQWFTKPSHSDWSWWQNTAGFQKLEDFWNRDFLTGPDPSAALNRDASDSDRKPLGLAEFCNGNFISENATYGDFFTDHSAKHWFQYPRLADTTQPNLRLLRWGGAEVEVRTNTITLRDGKSGILPYISKTKSGIYVTNHSALHYEAVKNPGKVANPQMHVMLTLNDSNVLQEYHSILIPKAIECSAGILDYFFRGTMSANVIGYNTNTMQYTNLIVNTSGQDFYGGSFSIYQDDTNGLRALIAQTNFTGITLQNSNSMTMISTPSFASLTNKFLLAYQGTIGITNGNTALDPVDANVGIAAQTFTPVVDQTMTTSYLVPVNQPGDSITNTLSSDDFPFAIITTNYEARIDWAAFDDMGTIGGVPCTDVFLSCTDPAGITNTVVPSGNVTISPDGKRMSVVVTATDDPICHINVGWFQITMKWRAWVPTP